MNPVSKVLIGLGIALILAGLLWQFGFRFGRLPGDIAIEKQNVRIYFPIVSSIIASIVLSLIFWIIRRFTG